ncbi:helix-turn-helix domain-containing protein [Paenibacillus sp. LHD-38]|uniref:helix-turn-helix domain-containing protein n=1 Tax=Paenibacillus sp. LHD-38 TaxID=3072143 RepID=UPI00281026C0|nr:helix-turn-helix domain-containing protein [Paenibacillus sp. LHD-38]MDQ8734143.1 helix-turn-helix domain-containing protein [Paenibacillus sp. LHD-38]
MKALIVDDEARVRKAVRLLVNWELHGITEIEEAGGGFEAIQRMRQDKPAIVIMDMMMPEGSGVDLMAAVNEFAGTVKFIVVSGRGDFDFVREAVRHGGIDYLLKPIEPEAINAAVAKAASQWRLEQQERTDRQKQSMRLNEFKPVYGEKLLTGLINEPKTAQMAVRRLQEEGLIPEGAMKARLALLQVDASDKQLQERFAWDSDLLHFAIINICNEFLIAKKRGVAFRHWGAPTEIVIAVWGENEQLPVILQDINEGIFITLQRRMHAGLSKAGDFPEAMPVQYEEALAALSGRNTLSANDYLHSCEEDKNVKRIAFSDWEEEWKVAALSGVDEQLAAASGRWLEAARLTGHISPYMLDEYKTEVLLFCARLLREAPGRQAVEEDALLSAEELAENSPYVNAGAFSLQDWREWSYRLLQRLSQAIVQRQAQEKTKMSDIASFIDQHYRDELSLQDIAKRFFVSREYVSRKFKQEYGINITDYITGIRIDKAKLLMVNPNLRVAKIAEMVGFHDEKYFSKVFKKQEGISPKAFRLKDTD